MENPNDDTQISRRTALRRLSTLSTPVLLGGVAGCSTEADEGTESPTTNSPSDVSSDTSEPTAEPTEDIGVGVFLGDDTSLAPWEDWLGRTADYYSFALFHDSWDDYLFENWPLEVPLDQIAEGRRIVLSFEMFPRETVEMESVAAGTHNDKYRRLARQMVENGLSEACVRTGWEFNGEWAIDGAVGRPELYVSAWKEVVRSMRSVDGADFSFIWAPNIWKKHMVPTDAYPGDEWVDQIGLTVYDKGDRYPLPDDCSEQCASDRRQHAWRKILTGKEDGYGLRFWANFAREHGKPLVFPEYGVIANGWQNSGGGDNPYFFEKFAAWMRDNADVVAWHNVWCWVAGPHYVGPKEVYATDKHPYMTDASEKYRELFGGEQ